MKRCSILYASEKYKLKQWDTSTNLLEWQKSRTLTTPKADENVFDWCCLDELSFYYCEMSISGKAFLKFAFAVIDICTQAL